MIAIDEKIAIFIDKFSNTVNKDFGLRISGWDKLIAKSGSTLPDGIVNENELSVIFKFLISRTAEIVFIGMSFGLKFSIFVIFRLRKMKFPDRLFGSS
jgi:hypothetical protein